MTPRLLVQRMKVEINVDQFGLAQSFIEHCMRGEPAAKLKEAFEAAIARLGLGYFACCSHTDPANPAPGAVMMYNYPSEWVRTFVEAQLHTFDPVLQYADNSRVPFYWNAPEFRAALTARQRQVMAAASTRGLRGGYTVPMRLSWWPGTLRASCSLVPDAGSLDPGNYAIAERLAMVLYAAAIYREAPVAGSVARIELSRRERQCLELAVQGNTDWEASRILKVSESTVHTYITRAMGRIGAMTRAHVVAYALMTGQIAFGDVHARTVTRDSTQRHTGAA
jgi:DNA-binding CsgD family transcriptional regulator